MSNGHFSYLFVSCIICSVFALVCGMAARLPKHTPKPKSTNRWDLRGYIEPKAIAISLSGSVLAFSYGAISTFLSVYAKEIGLEQIASYFFMVFAVMIIVSRPFTGRLFDRFGEHILVYPGLILFVVGMLGLSQARTPFLFLMTGAVIGLGFGALLPSFQAIAVKSSPIDRRGLATGTYFLLFDLGYGLGSYILGAVASKTSYGTMYFVGAIVTACAFLLYYGLHHRKTKTQQVYAQQIS